MESERRMTEPIGCFIDFESVRLNLSDEAKVHGIRYQTRPWQRGCQHKRVRYGAESEGGVNVTCKCGMLWEQVPVVRLPLSEVLP